MRIEGLGALLLAGLAVAGCAGTLEQGDVAYSRGDWDEAVVQYQEALASGMDPARRPQVQGRLEEARRKAGEAHAAGAARREAAGDLEGAVREAELAYRFAPSDATAARVRATKAAHAARLLQGGRSALDAGKNEEAVRLLTASLALAPNDEAQSLLARASDKADQSRRGEFWVSVEAGTKAMAAHDWATAVRHFGEAHRSGSNDESLRKEAFCKAMLAAEAAAAAGDERTARSRFEEALLWDIDAEYVRSRRDAAEESRRRAYGVAAKAGAKAMEARDWRAATTHFAAAHRAGSDPDSLRREAFCKAMLEAETAAAAGDDRVAQARFQEALLSGFDTEFVKSRRDAAEEAHRKAFGVGVAEGTKAMEARDWAAAVRHFAHAHRAGTPTEDTLRREKFCRAMLEAETAAAAGDERMARSRYEEALLAKIDEEWVRSRRDAAEEGRRKVYEASAAAGAKAMAARDWEAAVSQFAAAHRAGTSPDSLRKEAFCKAMLGAESAAAAGDMRLARARFEEALLSGVDSAHARARMDHFFPSDFVVTIHDGVILPFQPGTQVAWDGDAGRRLPWASELLDMLAQARKGGAASTASLGETMASVPADLDLPDTYLIVTTGGQTVSSREWVRHDTCRPSWEFRIPVHASPAGGEGMTVEVFDRDSGTDARIGSFQIPAGKLLANPGVFDLQFLDETGAPRAGGIVAVRFSVEKR